MVSNYLFCSLFHLSHHDCELFERDLAVTIRVELAHHLFEICFAASTQNIT